MICYCVQLPLCIYKFFVYNCENGLFLTELSWHMYRTDSQGTMAGGFFNSLYCKILCCLLVKYKPLITRTLGGNDASHKSVSCLDKTSTPNRVFIRKKSCWSSLHKTANIVPLVIKSATDSVCSSTMSSQSVSWSLSEPGDIRSTVSSELPTCARFRQGSTPSAAIHD